MLIEQNVQWTASTQVILSSKLHWSCIDNVHFDEVNIVSGWSVSSDSTTRYSDLVLSTIQLQNLIEEVLFSKSRSIYFWPQYTYVHIY